MLEIGIVGLDTSHPDSFAPFFRDRPDAELSAVWDGGTVQSAAETEEFCDRFDATLYDDPEAMVHDVDAALVLTVDWNSHVDLAVLFLEAGVPTLVDKPVAGQLEDLDRLEAVTRAGGALFGGSSIPFHPDLSDRVGAGGSTSAVGYNDPFYYGGHIVDVTRAVAGSDWDVVRPSDDPGETVDVWFDDGGHATVRLDGPPDTYEFGVMNVADDTFTTNIGGDDDKRREMYDSYLRRFLEVARGEGTDRDGCRVLDSATLLLAVHAALETDRPITPTCRVLREFEVDSAAFVAEYAEKRS
jgi:hypothetical protein